METQNPNYIPEDFKDTPPEQETKVKKQNFVLIIALALLLIIVSNSITYYVLTKEDAKISESEDIEVEDSNETGFSPPCPELFYPMTCDERCEQEGYASGICQSFSVTPVGDEEKELFEREGFNVGETRDCHVQTCPHPAVGISKICYCMDSNNSCLNDVSYAQTPGDPYEECMQILTTMVCPKDSSFQYKSRNSCESARLGERGWEEKK